jgi:hypothetical protein|tara:strand:- start:1372 stop:2421 length:1050 start_codon:yes stop_codon:yes gene_type:complete
MDLTEDQKKFIDENALKIKDLNNLTRGCFNDDSLDGRTKQGRSVRKYLIENSIEFKTTKTCRSEDIIFTDQQKEFILQQAEGGLSSLEIAKLIFPNKRVKPLSNEQRTVLSFIREINPDILPSQDSGALHSYLSPKSPSRIVKKINDSTGLGLEEPKLNRQKRICVERLGINLNNSRFLKIINNYLNEEDRILFEHEFVRLTWDKPDLTADELNLYLNVCKEVINLEVISAHLNKLNDMFDIADDQNEMSVRLAEIIKAKSGEYHQCETRIENLTKKLQGDRAERMKKSQKENASFLSIVQLFQEEEERKTMARIAEMQKQTIKEEAERIEGMAEWKARVLGISQEDAI